MIVGIDFQRAAEFLQRLLNHSFVEIDPPQINIRKVARLVARRRFGTLQPGNGVVEALLLHKVDADVIVGVAEFGVELDGDLALGDGFVEPSLKTIGPAEIGMGIGSRVNGNGFLIKQNGLVEFRAI